MVIKKKEISKKSINEIINRGGSTTSKSKKRNEIKFTLRISDEMKQKIDNIRNEKSIKISRNQWILEAIDKVLKKN